MFTGEGHERARYARDLAAWVNGSVRNQRALSALLEAQREVALDARLPAVALAVPPLQADRLRALLSGFQAVLPAPVDPDELARVLGSLSGWLG